MNDPDEHVVLFGTLDELAATVATQKAALRTAAIEFAAECGLVVGPRGLAAIDAMIAPGLAQIDRHAAVAEAAMRRFEGLPSN